MGGQDYIPSADTAFDGWQKRLVETISLRCSDWNISMAAHEKILNLQQVWEKTFNIASDPARRTQTAVLEKNNARKAYEVFLRSFVKEFLQYNSLVTDGDRSNMGLTIYTKSHTPIPAPTTIPEAEIDTSVLRRLTIHFHDSGSTKKAKPHGVHGAEIRWEILENKDVKIDDLLHSEFDTRTPFTLEFKDQDRGKTLYFCLRWENTKGEKGPWGDLMSAIIP